MPVLATLAGFGAYLAMPNDLDAVCAAAAEQAIAHFKARNVKPEQIGIAIRFESRRGGYRADQAMYPASVVKLFFLAHAHQRLEERFIKRTPELDRAMKDMIVVSSNDATGLIVDAVTTTTGGTELGPRELRRWMQQRQATNAWFKRLGYTGVNACQKTWNEGPYGREKQGYGENWALRNMLTPAASLRLMKDIIDDRIVTPARCAEMRGLLARTIIADDPQADFQSRAFVGKVLPKGSRLWSKAGFTSTVRHDLAHVQLPTGQTITLAVYTEGQSTNVDLIPFLTDAIFRGLDLPRREVEFRANVVRRADVH
jgi:hypothetical protein